MLEQLTFYFQGGLSTCNVTETFCVCKSTESKWYICAFVPSTNITSVNNVHRMDASSCDFSSGLPEHYTGQEGAYGYSGNLLWVSNGCRAYFTIGKTTIGKISMFLRYVNLLHYFRIEIFRELLTKV